MDDLSRLVVNLTTAATSHETEAPLDQDSSSSVKSLRWIMPIVAGAVFLIMLISIVIFFVVRKYFGVNGQENSSKFTSI